MQLSAIQQILFALAPWQKQLLEAVLGLVVGSYLTTLLHRWPQELGASQRRTHRMFPVPGHVKFLLLLSESHAALTSEQQMNTQARSGARAAA